MKKRILILVVLVGLILSLSGCVGFDCVATETVYVPSVRYSTIIYPYHYVAPAPRPYIRYYDRRVPPTPIGRRR